MVLPVERPRLGQDGQGFAQFGVESHGTDRIEAGRSHAGDRVATRQNRAALRDRSGRTASATTSEAAMPATLTRRLVTLADAADALAVSTRTVRRYIADGQLEAVRLGRKTLRIKADSIERFIDAKPVGNWR